MFKIKTKFFLRHKVGGT